MAAGDEKGCCYAGATGKVREFWRNVALIAWTFAIIPAMVFAIRVGPLALVALLIMLNLAFPIINCCFCSSTAAITMKRKRIFYGICLVYIAAITVFHILVLVDDGKGPADLSRDGYTQAGYAGLLLYGISFASFFILNVLLYVQGPDDPVQTFPHSADRSNSQDLFWGDISVSYVERHRDGQEPVRQLQPAQILRPPPPRQPANQQRSAQQSISTISDGNISTTEVGATATLPGCTCFPTEVEDAPHGVLPPYSEFDDERPPCPVHGVREQPPAYESLSAEELMPYRIVCGLLGLPTYDEVVKRVAAATLNASNPAESESQEGTSADASVRSNVPALLRTISEISARHEIMEETNRGELPVTAAARHRPALMRAVSEVSAILVENEPGLDAPGDDTESGAMSPEPCAPEMNPNRIALIRAVSELSTALAEDPNMAALNNAMASKGASPSRSRRASADVTTEPKTYSPESTSPKTIRRQITAIVEEDEPSSSPYLKRMSKNTSRRVSSPEAPLNLAKRLDLLTHDCTEPKTFSAPNTPTASRRQLIAEPDDETITILNNIAAALRASGAGLSSTGASRTTPSETSEIFTPAIIQAHAPAVLQVLSAMLTNDELTAEIMEELNSCSNSVTLPKECEEDSTGNTSRKEIASFLQNGVPFKQLANDGSTNAAKQTTVATSGSLAQTRTEPAFHSIEHNGGLNRFNTSKPSTTAVVHTVTKTTTVARPIYVRSDATKMTVNDSSFASSSTRIRSASNLPSNATTDQVQDTTSHTTERNINSSQALTSSATQTKPVTMEAKSIAPGKAALSQNTHEQTKNPDTENWFAVAKSSAETRYATAAATATSSSTTKTAIKQVFGMPRELTHTEKGDLSTASQSLEAQTTAKMPTAKQTEAVRAISITATVTKATSTTTTSIMATKAISSTTATKTISTTESSMSTSKAKLASAASANSTTETSATATKSMSFMATKITPATATAKAMTHVTTATEGKLLMASTSSLAQKTATSSKPSGKVLAAAKVTAAGVTGHSSTASKTTTTPMSTSQSRPPKTKITTVTTTPLIPKPATGRIGKQ